MKLRLRQVILSFSALCALSGCDIAPEDAPWEPLSLEHPIGWATQMKLAALADDRAQCKMALETAQSLEFRNAAPGAGTTACPLAGAVAIERSTISYGQELAASCRLAAVIYIWEREVVQPAAQTHFQSSVARIDTLGTFACRNIYNRADARRSEHASANALDVAGFRLENGERISVLADWNDVGSEGAFLRQVREGSCALFNGVLSPDYNAAHADHFHFDMGPYRICS